MKSAQNQQTATRAAVIDRADPRGLQRIFVDSVLKALSHIRHGHLTLQLPNHQRFQFGSREEGPRATITLHSWRGLSRLVTNGSIGAGEGFTDGDWDCDNLPGLIYIFCINEDAFYSSSFLFNLLHRVLHWTRRNSLNKASDNISAHYDLGNDFYRLFLDDSMTYSSAKFQNPDESLEEAQCNKYRAIAEGARITPGMRILEIGCGWGGFAEFAVREYDCHVTGISLSREQLAYAEQHAEKSGLADRISYQYMDYRKMTGRFDRIVSIEMLEAVGHQYLDSFFEKCEQLLAPEGVLALQSIIIPDQRYLTYRKNPDWIAKYIFPGGHLPSLSALLDAARRKSVFVVDSISNIGMHYAETLRRWRVRFLEEKRRLLQEGYEPEFLRMWEFYLAYCEGAFLSRYLQDLQIFMTRPMNMALGAFPYLSADPKMENLEAPQPAISHGALQI